MSKAVHIHTKICSRAHVTCFHSNILRVDVFRVETCYFAGAQMQYLLLFVPTDVIYSSIACTRLLSPVTHSQTRGSTCNTYTYDIFQYCTDAICATAYMLPEERKYCKTLIYYQRRLTLFMYDQRRGSTYKLSYISPEETYIT